MDKKEFRRLYKELYTTARVGSGTPVMITDHDLDKISDRVFKAFDGDGSGKLTFEGKTLPVTGKSVFIVFTFE